MYQVFARKWRPTTFDELVGQQAVARTLKNAIETDRLAHAYIFSGLRGTGKTSAARILARCLNCADGPTVTPCGTCPSCVEIPVGRSIDVLEIDAASRTKVEQTREVLETLSYAPSRDPHKILIVDEVHMLSKHSFNALLKTLEEPPERVVFVLATTELHKILPTILSRCQVFEFRRVPPRPLAAHLRRVCDAEGVSIDDASIERIARAGDGSVRDALSVLERVVAFSGTDVSDDDVMAALGAVGTATLVGFFEALDARDAGGMLATLDAVCDEGRDLTHFWSELLSVVRDLMLARTASGRDDLLARSPEDVEALSKAASTLTLEDLSRAFGVLAGLESGLKLSSQPRYLFEAALVKLASLGAVRPIEELIASLDSGGPPLAPPRGGPGGAGRPPRPTDGPKRRESPPARRAAPSPDRSGRANATSPDGPPSSPPARFSSEAFAAEVRRRKPALREVIRSAVSIDVEQDRLVLTLPAEATFELRQLEQPHYRDVIEEASLAAGGPRPWVARAASTVSGPAGGGPSPAGRPPEEGDPSRKSYKQIVDRARSEPGVRRLLSEFGAQIVDARPLAESPPVESIEDTA